MKLIETRKKISKKDCVIEVYGLGYIGFPLSIKLSKAGFRVLGVETGPDKLKRLENGLLIENEKYLETDYKNVRKKGNLIFSNSSRPQSKPKIGIICVPTPIPKKDIQSDHYVILAVRGFLSSAKSGDIIIIESSLEVGTTETVEQLIEKHGFRLGDDIGLAYCPERIDPKNKKWNLHNIPRVVFSSDDITFSIIKKIYNHLNKGNLFRVETSKTVEVIKSFENAFRLVNISLVNELAILCDKLGINISNVIKGASTKPFGFMPFYFGAGAGGHCIPKDPIFLLNSSKKFSYNFETIESAIKINSFMPIYISNTINKIIKNNNFSKSVIVCGLSYKMDMPDMRDSPGFKIVREFKNKGYHVSIHDPFLQEKLVDKYFKENEMEQLNVKILHDLKKESISGIGCLVIVQHHNKTIPEINKIYKKSLVPFIYDCQGKLKKDKKASCLLKGLGNLD
ncbi:MAG: nucleotide sugar dehydrogenase [Nitrosopumilaceae archaeon]